MANLKISEGFHIKNMKGHKPGFQNSREVTGQKKES